MRHRSAESRTPVAATRHEAAGRTLRWPGVLLLALFVLGSAAGLALWGRWGFLIAFDTLRAYCF